MALLLSASAEARQSAKAPPARTAPDAPTPPVLLNPPSSPEQSPLSEPPPAQRAQLSKSELETALAEASAQFKAGQHLEAANKLLLVYDSDPQPLLLFNAGQAYRRAKRPKEAKEAYLRFLEAAPNHSLGPEVRGYVRDMETLLELQQREQAISLQLQQEKAVATSAQQALQKERNTPVYKRPWFWLLIGGAGLAIIGAGSAAIIINERTKSDSQAILSR